MWPSRIVATTGAALALWLAYCLSGVASRLLRIAQHRPETAVDAVRFGLLGAAKVAPHGLLFPAAMIESATVVAVGARDPSRAHRLASKWRIPRSGDYASVLADPAVEAVYIPLLNGLHYEWATAALRVGKHVLCEKPLTSNAAEARSLSRLAKASGLVLFEAFHYKYHPVVQRVVALVGGGSELGDVLELEVSAGRPCHVYMLADTLRAAGCNTYASGQRRAAVARLSQDLARTGRQRRGATQDGCCARRRQLHGPGSPAMAVLAMAVAVLAMAMVMAMAVAVAVAVAVTVALPLAVAVAVAVAVV